MYCWSPTSALHHQTAFISPSPASRPFQYDLLAMPQRQACYFQNQAMFPARRTRSHSTPIEYSSSACAKAPLSLSIGGIASPSRLEESFVYQGKQHLQ